MNQALNQKTVAELASLVNGEVCGDASTNINRVAAFDETMGDRAAGAITFIEDAKSLERAQETNASCVIIKPEHEIEGVCAIKTARPKLAFARIAAVLHPRRTFTASVHPTAHIAPDALIADDVYIAAHVVTGANTRIGQGTQIHAGVCLGNNVTIGRECVIHPRVVIYDNVTIGDNVVLHAGAVIGADGFGYVRDVESYVKFPQIGTVVIEDDVEIGAQTCIDRGALGQTRIGRGTKIDNLVQIGHNVRIGNHVVIAAQTGISGSCVIEDDAVIGGQVGFGDHARVERGAIIGSKAGVLPGKIVRGGGKVYWGVPVRPLDEYKRINAAMGRLPQMREELERLRRQVEELNAKADSES
ncbi:MAG: UDP-3-O-(3-hydroxymyristoyl)glucosamine N-acyltransferase [Pyrinomonadaceae bacterium MAG19_C2-C3]|nr:UDP-3-O-(3-hydroxymyristoyl)glucosamine N-acyltransferase [Pyrinomonadaceae bacterium MAG19_C2-C3]